MSGILKLFFVILLLISPVFLQTSEKLKIVNLDMIVVNKLNNSVSDIKQEEIVITEKGKPQTVTSFTREEKPLIYALTVDNSGSFKALLNIVKEASNLIVAENRINDEAAVIWFSSSDNVNFAQEFTKDKSLLSKTIGEFAPAGGETALIDAIYLAVESTAKYKSDNNSYRRAVLIISDGEDRDSYYTESQLLKLIGKENVQVFFIGIVELLSDEKGFSDSSQRGKAKTLIEKIVKKSGGVAFFPKSPQELREAALKVRELMKSQYVVSYSVAEAQKKDCHEPEIEFVKNAKRKDDKIIVRNGCFNPRDK